MIRIIIFAYLIILVLGKPSSDFVEENLSSEIRIVGGRTAKLGQFPYQVSLRNFYPEYNHHFCGGILANDRWIVSAAHCTINELPSNIFSVVGTISRIHGGDKYNIERIINHPNFDKTMNFDISLLLTTQNIIFTENIRPIALGSKYVKGGVFAVVSGWGRTSPHPNTDAEILQYLKVLVISNAKCKRKIGNLGKTKICHYDIWGRGGHCRGDSGGPLVAKNTAIGIVSWFVNYCGSGLPDAYERISSHRNWILNIFNNKQ